MKRATSPLARLGWPWIVLFLLWLAFVLAGYYVVQNAFLQPTLERIRLMAWLPAGVSAAALGRAALDLLAAGLIALAGLNLGGWLLDRLRPAGLEPAERLIFGQALGLGLLGLAVLGLGLVGLLERGILLALVLVPAGLGLRANLARLRPLAAARPPRLLLLYGLPAGVLALALALLPPTAWDGLFYHLTGPKLYLELGAIQPAADIPHLNFPFLQEMLFLLAMSIHSDRAAVLLHFLYAPLLVGLVVLFARRHFGLRNGWLAAVFLLSMPMLLSLAAWAYNDLALAFFEVGALYALLRQRQATQGAPAGAPAAGRADLILAGLLAGFGLGLKYTAVVAVVPLGLLLLRWGRRRPRLALGRLALFGLTAGLLLTPWLLKNWAFTSNPVYPFVFGGQNWDTFRAAAYAEAGTGIAYNPAGCRQGPPEHLHGQHPTGCAFDAAYLARRLLTLPYGLTLGIHDTSRDGDPGPLFLVFLPLALLYGLGRRERRPAALTATLFFALIHLAFWIYGVIQSAPLWQSRLLLPAFVALCPALAWMLEQLAEFDTPRFSLRRQLLLVAGLVLAVGLSVQVLNWLPQQPWAYLGGQEGPAENLRRRLGAHYAAMELLEERLPAGARVFFLWEPRSYYCRLDCQPDSILDAFGHLTHLHGDAAGARRALRGRGFTHVLLFRAGLNLVLASYSAGDEPPDPPVLAAFLSEELEPLAEVAGGAYVLYALPGP